MDNPLVSVIIPVYNVEKYVEHCVRSVMNQTYQNLEIILVDDGSPDRSGEICDELAQEDHRIVVYHKPNGGLSDARNYGVSHSSGEYVSFIDSDDYVAFSFVEEMVLLCEGKQTDIACCAPRLVLNHHEDQSVEMISDTTILNGEDACSLMLSGKAGKELQLSSACGKLYRRKLLLKYPYPVAKRFEDTQTTYKILYTCSAIALNNTPLYFYYQNNDGIVSTSRRKKDSDRIEALISRAKGFGELGNLDLEKKAWEFTLRYLYSDSIAFQGRSDKELKEVYTYAVDRKMISYSKRIQFGIYLAFPVLYRFLRKMI